MARRRVERELRDSRTAGVAVVDEDRRLHGLRVQRHRHPADVPAVADREQREHPDQAVLGRVHRADQRGGVDARRLEHLGRRGVPARARHERALGQVELADLDDAVRRDPLALERDDLVANFDAAEMHDRVAERRERVLADDRDVGGGAGLRVLVGVVARLQQRDVLGGVEPLDAVLPALVQVHRAGVRDREDPGVVDGADGAFVAEVEEPVLDRRAAPQAHAARRGLPARPVHPARPRREQVGVHEIAHRVVEAGAEPALVLGRERQLLRGARDLRAHDEGVLRVDDRVLGRALRQLGGMRRVPLVELVVARDEDRRRTAAGAPGPPRLLPHRGERAGEPVEHDRVEAADVDAELQRVRRGDAEQPPARQLELQRAALLGEVARAISTDAVDELGRDSGEAAARVLRDDLRAAPAAGERERLVVGAHEAREQLGRLDVGGAARTRVRVEQGPLPAREHPLGTRRGVVVDLADVEAAQRARELARVADRRACEEERGARSIVLAQPAEAAQHVRDVRAEDAAQRVELVDYDVLEPHEERRPPFVRRQDPHVQHLGIGEHDVRVLARPRAVVGGRVTVVGDGAQSRNEPGAQRAQLVLGERLGGEEQQRGVAPLFDDRRHDRQLVAERLARGGPRGDDDALPIVECVERGGLVRVQPGDAAGAQPGRDLGVQRARGICVPGRPFGKDLAMDAPADQLGIGGELVEQRTRVHRPEGTDPLRRRPGKPRRSARARGVAGLEGS